MWRVTADNGLPRCEVYRWARFGLLGSSFGGGLAVSGRGGATCFPLSGGGSGLGGEGQLLTGSQHPGDGDEAEDQREHALECLGRCDQPTLVQSVGDDAAERSQKQCGGEPRRHHRAERRAAAGQLDDEPGGGE